MGCEVKPIYNVMKEKDGGAVKRGAAYGLIDFPQTVDTRGTLCVADVVRQRLPFAIARVFWITGVPEGRSRGEHAHRTCSEIVIPVCGSFTARVTDGEHSDVFCMNSHSKGLYIPPMVWCGFSDFSADCVCLCLASHPYEREGYINDFEQFLKEVEP